MRRLHRRAAAATRALEVDASRSPTWRSAPRRRASSLDTRRPWSTQANRVTLDAAIAKLYSTDTCVAVSQSAVDLCAPEFGADDHPAAVRFRDAKACQIYEGTNQIQRVVIARHLLHD